MSDVDIRREHGKAKGRYVALKGGHEAELTYSIASSKLVIADHTGVPDALRGTGIGAALVDRLIADARSDGFRVVPLCPYVKSRVLRHPEWADVIQN